MRTYLFRNRSLSLSYQINCRYMEELDNDFKIWFSEFGLSAQNIHPKLYSCVHSNLLLKISILLGKSLRPFPEWHPSEEFSTAPSSSFLPRTVRDSTFGWMAPIVSCRWWPGQRCQRRVKRRELSQWLSLCQSMCTTCTTYGTAGKCHWNMENWLVWCHERIADWSYYSSTVAELDFVVIKSKSYEQLLMAVTFCWNSNAPDAIAHCAFKLTHDIATTPQIPPNNAFCQMEKRNTVKWMVQE